MLPEDGANRQLATGFLLELDLHVLRRVQVLEEAGGWLEVLDRFGSDHARAMDRYPNRLVVLLIDFDGDEERSRYAKDRIPQHLRPRVFIVGAWTEPEHLKRAGLGSYEEIGLRMARDCRTGCSEIWAHALLRHNEDELERLRKVVRPLLF